MDELLLLEILNLKQQLEIASMDIERITGDKAEDYLHDLSTRDYYDEISKHN